MLEREAKISPQIMQIYGKTCAHGAARAFGITVTSYMRVIVLSFACVSRSCRCTCTDCICRVLIVTIICCYA